METSELLKRVRRIEIKTRGLSSNIFAGQYHSAFKGRGMAFSEVREYQYGDDIRDIDWNVTARFDKPFVKVFEEERELTVMLLVDVSNSLDFGTAVQMKKDMVTEIAATIAFSAIQNNDKIGVVFFSDRIEKFIPPKKGRKHILYIIRELLDFHPQSTRTNVQCAVEYLTNVLKKRCTAFVLSDFIDSHDFLQTLLGNETKGREYVIEAAGSLAVSDGEWKYIAPSDEPAYNKLTNTELGNSKEEQLYCLKEDPGEQVNVAHQYPDKVKAFQAILEREKQTGYKESWKR